MAPAESVLDLIEKKKWRRALSETEILRWVKGLTAGRVPDYQTAALLMAIRLNGMNFDETLALTRAMTESGDKISFEGYPILADKHSTGGVGDKVSLVLAPLVAACGLPVTMLSGRGLGFTGGTIDKLEALPGVSCKQSPAQMARMLKEFGWANARASRDIVPADRILYALRDVTGTVDSLPLITASILSKKIAGGATHLCLDVKCGPSAFMTDLSMATELARYLKTIGEQGGIEVSGLITRMEEPLGHALGNYLELMEAVAYLQSEHDTPLMELVYALGSQMLAWTGFQPNLQAARKVLREALRSGRGLEKLIAYLRFTGGENAALDQLPKQDFADLQRVALHARGRGVVTAIDGRRLGEWLIALGAGRVRQDDRVDPTAGIVLNKHVGDPVHRGDVLAWLYGERALQSSARDLSDYLENCYQLGTAVSPAPVVLNQF